MTVALQNQDFPECMQANDECTSNVDLLLLLCTYRARSIQTT